VATELSYRKLGLEASATPPPGGQRSLL
jgi:hypothetical protein